VSEEGEATPSRYEVARLLAELGTLLEMNGAETFRARAFTNAARALEGIDADLEELARTDRLTTLKGIGAGIAGIVREYVLTGRSTLHEELAAATPVGLYELLRVPGLGPKRIHTLHKELGVASLDDLERAAEGGAIASLPGFGPKTEKKIREGIGFARSSRKLRRYPEALEAAVALLEWLRAQPSVADAQIAGALRRRMEVVDRVDLVACGETPEEVLERFVQALGGEGLADLEDRTARMRLADGMEVRLRCVLPGQFVAAMVWDTGSDAHVAALAARAVKRAGTLTCEGLVLDDSEVALERESGLYRELDLAYVEPELREGLDELELAESDSLPELVELEDLTGTFHCHTTYSDGKATLEEMVEGARERGWSYLGIADHSRTAAYAGGLPAERVLEQHREIDGLNARLSKDTAGFRLFKGIESDILPDGSLDYPESVLRRFDYVVGSVHSSFRMGREEMTERFLRAIASPHLTILGHPTGRLLLSREGYSFDVDAVIEAAARAGVVIEINANPHRLDLDWRHVREAAARGVLIAVNPDAHSVAALDHVAFGINMARKAGLEPRQVLNTWAVEEIAEYLEARKQKSKA
jgi:DNA polymerase (family X)